MNGDLLYRVNHLLIGLLVWGLMLAAYEVGFRFGRRRHMGDAARNQTASIQASVLALLGLLLGFTLSMAVNRFELRKVLAVDEVNAIGTAWLRSRAWPEVEKEARLLLAEYVALRLEVRGVEQNSEAALGLVQKATALQEKLWVRALAVANADTKSVPAGLYLQSLNEMIDLQAKRMAASANHVPATVLLLLYAISIAALGTVGYGGGLANLTRSGAAYLLGPLVVLVLIVIMDLDRPYRGLIQSDVTAFGTLHEQLKASPGPEPRP